MIIILCFNNIPYIMKQPERYYYWETKSPHSNNNITLNDFIENHLEKVLPEFEVTYEDGSYCVVKKGSKKFEIHASGNGDFTHHKVEIIPIT